MLKKAQVQSAVKNNRNCLIRGDLLKNLELIEEKNHRLQTIVNDIFKNESWRLLWIPPTAKYYELEGAFKNYEDNAFTKALVFSSWKVVPRAIASLISHKSESYAFKNGPYKEIEAYKTSQLLPIRQDEKSELGGLRTFILLYPSYYLTKKVNIFELSRECNGSLSQIKSLVKDILRDDLFLIISKYGSEDEKEDQNWYWAAPLLLDKESDYSEKAKDWAINGQELGWYHSDFEEESIKKEEKIFNEHVEKYQEVLRNGIRLGKPPRDILDVLVDIALGSPANLIVRSLRKIVSPNPDNPVLTEKAIFHYSAICSQAVRTLFNSSEAISILKGNEVLSAHEVNEPYWKEVLKYCVDGCFQSVLDEYFHLLKLDEGLFEGVQYNDDFDNNYIDSFEPVCDIFFDVISMRQGRLNVDIIDNPNGRMELEPFSVRCKFALSYGDWKSEDGKLATRANDVRHAFNSPFRPFVLATTSIGQEGLDFHKYCHSIYHWNLPRNPVDLEQREGRIHRFKGHVIRKNVASDYSILNSKTKDPWEELFEKARLDRRDDVNDLVPYWIYESSKINFKVNRYVPIIPFSRDEQHFDDLLKTLAKYRLAFGQPRQEELLKVLEDSTDLNEENLKKIIIDLSAN